MKSLPELFQEWFLNQSVEVQTPTDTIRGRLVQVERSQRSAGFLGSILLINDKGPMLIRGSQVRLIRRIRQ